MANHLIDENSPYLLQHVENPVNWYPWNSAALERASSEDKPIFLSIGYAACHWCHVMAHESFEDTKTAALLNRDFISIKVDREERPDLDSIYMQAVVAMTGQGGWPMSVFLTPDGRPFYGGTYFPPEPRYNMPSFRDILQSIASLWAEDRQQLLHNADVLTTHLQETLEAGQSDSDFDPGFLEDVSLHLAQSYHWKTGGWGSAPKFPHPMTIEFALRRAARGDQTSRQMAVHALETMARGGMYDLLGGGFARYSVDENWHVPHFEKMLYDNALLARTYLHAALLTRDSRFKRICEETLDFVLREMTHPNGGFFSSLDADSEGTEGKYYTWTTDEVEDILDDKDDFMLFSTAFGLTADGDLEGRNVLRQRMEDEKLAGLFQLSMHDVSERLAAARGKLLNARDKRIRPALDDKIITSWNALMLTAFSEAGRYLDRAEYTMAAERNASFLLEEMMIDNRLLRSWRNGLARHNAYLEDHAALIQGLVALYQTVPEPCWFQAALSLAEDMVNQFFDADTGFHDTRADHETLLIRPGDTQDNAIPSGSSLAAGALLQLASLQGNQEWHRMAASMLASRTADMHRHPTTFSQWLCEADFAAGPVFEVAVLGELEQKGTQELLQVLKACWRPNVITAVSPPPAASEHPALLHGRLMQERQPTAFVCTGSVCHLPVNTPAGLRKQLGDCPEG